MDALYPRLLVRDFAAAADFYTKALRELFGVEPVKVIPEAQYANWDLEGQTGLVLFGRDLVADTIGTAGLPAEAETQDSSMLVFKVDSVDAGTVVLEKLGATVLAAPQDRPQWGPNLRTAHLRAPNGTLLELQTY
ncbi:glyoxalase/bleomycin resistance/extradiol dioxygenase family protein [Kribbella antibiotica]|uniref:Glyoxalase/bleomycin resistance/extradiol dioxygenase family protein n=1 Tax=Kribbella antibiotica TaxID=190195 RepID=A0A4R4ZRV3_9ACTN|nr:VOC family protein [Kribbella antibiotica]TDD61768.1 glyoxalase/bleomycin resistance/extradiol dioxygenase family protein [Kribbella antibiotica]